MASWSQKAKIASITSAEGIGGDKNAVFITPWGEVCHRQGGDSRENITPHPEK